MTVIDNKQTTFLGISCVVVWLELKHGKGAAMHDHAFWNMFQNHVLLDHGLLARVEPCVFGTCSKHHVFSDHVLLVLKVGITNKIGTTQNTTKSYN